MPGLVGTSKTIAKKVADDAAQGSAIALKRQAQLERAEQKMAQLEEYFDNTSPVQRDTPTPPPEEALEQAQRSRFLFETDFEDATEAFGFQTHAPEEFHKRLRTQLANPGFASQLVGLKPVHRMLSDERALMYNDRLMGSLEGRPRAVSQLKAWHGDSPYTEDLVGGDAERPLVFFHTDRVTRQNTTEPLIQFTPEANEFGLHMGTHAAAHQFVAPHKLDELEYVYQELETEIQTLAGFTDRTPEEVRKLLVKAIDTSVEQRFSKSKDLLEERVALYDDIEQLVKDTSAAVGASEEMAVDSLRQLYSLLGSMSNPSITPTVFRGKNGLFLEDVGNWTAPSIIDQLLDRNIFPDDVDELLSIRGAGDRRRINTGLREFLESRGYDHIAYNNTVEDRSSVSVITWKEDQVKSLYAQSFDRNNQNILAAIAGGVFTAPLIAQRERKGE